MRRTWPKVKEEQLWPCEEEKKLKLTEEERRIECLRFKSEVKHEIAKCNHEEEYFMKERKGLNQDKEDIEQ